jgi:hypothetical protein
VGASKIFALKVTVTGRPDVLAYPTA